MLLPKRTPVAAVSTALACVSTNVQTDRCCSQHKNRSRAIFRTWNRLSVYCFIIAQCGKQSEQNASGKYYGKASMAALLRWYDARGVRVALAYDLAKTAGRVSPAQVDEVRATSAAASSGDGRPIRGSST